MKTYQDLLDELVSEGVLKRHTPLYSAFADTDRSHFIRREDHESAYMNTPLYIGYGQTASQPYTVAFMLNHLGVCEGHRVLEVGYGSGWQTVILSKLVGKYGEVHATELVPEIQEFGEINMKKFSHDNIYTYQAHHGTLGVHEKGPFHRIMSGASATSRDVVRPLLDQLALDGIMITPVGNQIVVFKKDSEGRVEIEEYPGFVFVPLITE